jgi:cyclic-di-GMP phosphodiesterase TipF (flagellum assembly factor)
VQTLVYLLIGLAALAVAGAAYFGFTFTPIEAIMLALLFAGLAVIAMERTLRQRAESRLEKAVEDLSRLLSIDSQAGQVLSQRINGLADVNAGKRLEALEADISVLGTVMRQVAEAVAEIEERGVPEAAAAAPAQDRAPAVAAPAAPQIPEPVIPLEMVREALDQDRLVFYVQPIVTLPQRRAHGYDLQPLLLLEDGELAPAADFMPVRGGEDVVRTIEGRALEEAVTITRRARTNGMPIALYVPLSRPSLANQAALDQITVMLAANKAVSPNLNFIVPDAQWQKLAPGERKALAAIAGAGATFSLADIASLRLDFADLQGQGVRSVRIDATRFIDEPEVYTDFHASDIASYVKRFGIEMLGTGVTSEQQIISLLEDGISLAQGSYIASPGPVRSDLVGERRPPIAEVKRARP